MGVSIFLLNICLILITNVIFSSGIGNITVPNKYMFPYGNPVVPFIGLFAAIAIPIEVKNVDMFVSVNFEANYNLPSNQTSFSYPPDISGRNIPIFTRKDVYRAIESKLEGHGYYGQECLLRMICECAEENLDHNGILGDLINLILRPSFSQIENDTLIYQEAENYGHNNNNCEKYNEKCPKSILKLISWSYDKF